MARPGSERHSAIESLKERIARDPLSRAFLQLAEEYRKEGRYQEAVKVCMEGLERHPTYHTARISLGRTLMEAGNLVDARRAFSEVLELQPENHLAGKLLAEVQKKTGDGSGAAETYRAILRYYPGDKEVEGFLAEVQGDSAARPATPPAPASQPARPAAQPGPLRTAPAAQTPPAPLRTSPAAQASPATVRLAPGGASVSVPAARPAQVPAAPAPAVPARPRPADPAVDFQAGDLDGAGFTAGAVAEGPSGPWGEAATGVLQDDDAGGGDDALHTNTLAELYLRQGLVDKAVEVYRSMLRVDPDNQKAARRLADLAPGGAPSTAPARPHTAPVIVRPAPAADERESPAAPILQAMGAVGQETGPAARAVEPVPPKRDGRIDRLERWLDRMRAGGVREASPR